MVEKERRGEVRKKDDEEEMNDKEDMKKNIQNKRDYMMTKYRSTEQ